MKNSNTNTGTHMHVRSRTRTYNTHICAQVCGRARTHITCCTHADLDLALKLAREAGEHLRKNFYTRNKKKKTNNTTKNIGKQ